MKTKKAKAKNPNDRGLQAKETGTEEQCNSQRNKPCGLFIFPPRQSSEPIQMSPELTQRYDSLVFPTSPEKTSLANAFQSIALMPVGGMKRVPESITKIETFINFLKYEGPESSSLLEEALIAYRCGEKMPSGEAAKALDDFLALGAGGLMNLSYCAKLGLAIKEYMGADLNSLIALLDADSGPVATRQEIINRMLKQLSAVFRLLSPTDRHHGKNTFVETIYPSEKEVREPEAWVGPVPRLRIRTPLTALAIATAFDLAKNEGRDPLKYEVQKELEAKHPELQEQNINWSATFKRAGLKSLPTAQPHHGASQEKIPSAKQKKRRDSPS
ncbi:MAG: hypothetical protein ACO1TE_27230 [Prosthecobacter sp.]